MAITTNKVATVSCYCSPNSGIAEFETFLEQLGWDLANLGGSAMVSAGFNAMSPECLSRTRCIDRRGWRLGEWIASRALSEELTFVRGAGRMTPNLTLSGER